MIEVGIVGATGYTGAELLRLLVNHPQVKITMITSRAEAGIAVSKLYPSLRGRCDLAFCEPNEGALAACDVVFFATPHGVAQGMMTSCLPLSERLKEESDDKGRTQSAAMCLCAPVGGDTWSGAFAASCLSGILWPVYN